MSAVTQHAADMAILASADAQLKDAVKDFDAVIKRTTDPIDLQTLRDLSMHWIDAVVHVRAMLERRTDEIARELEARR